MKAGKLYTVVEGNTRTAAYKVITGLLSAPTEYAASVPHVSNGLKATLLSVDCTIAPDRDALLPIMASAHFGLGDKSKWGYLGSRKAVYDEWKAGKTVAQLTRAFDRTKGQIHDLILEYRLYLAAIGLKWTKEEKDILLDPTVEFNPPVRFLQTSGHKAKIGISYDKANLKVDFDGAAAQKKFKHLLLKLVISPEQGLGATAKYDEVFADYEVTSSVGKSGGSQKPGKTMASDASGGDSASSATGTGTESGGSTDSKLKSGALFNYPVSTNSGLLQQLMKEARELNCKKFPAAGTFLIRNIVEAILKNIIHEKKANPDKKTLDLEMSINLCMGKTLELDLEDKKVLKEFHKSYVSYLNLGAHGNVIPNYDMVKAARDCIDQFVKRNL